MKSKKQPKKRSLEKTSSEAQMLKMVGQRIIEMAAKRNVSLEKVAYEGDISKGYLYDLVKGRANPSLLILSRIASSLEVSLSKLISI